jgi:Laminin G domain.
MRKKLFGILVLSLLVLGFNGIGNASLTDGLVAYYPFNGNANDESGNGNNGTVNGATLTTDRFGNANNAYSFNGVNNEVRVLNPFGQNVPNSLSISVWIKTTSTKDAGAIVTQVTACINNTDDHFGIALYNLSDDKELKADIFNGTTAKTDRSLVADGFWHHIAVVGTDKSISLYVDGKIKFLASSTPVFTYDPAINLVIGGVSFYACSYNSYFEGSIDDVYIYNRALSDAEIQELYNGQSCYNEGFAAGVAACKANPTSCGINVNPGTAVTLTPDLKMHLPNIQYNTILGIMSIWADLAYDGTKTDAMYFKVTGAGFN